MPNLNRLFFPFVAFCLSLSFYVEPLQACSECKKDLQNLHTLFDRYFEYSLQESPELATILGHKGLDHLWTDMSEERIAQRSQAVLDALAELKTIKRDKLGKADRINYDVLKSDLEDAIRWMRFKREYLTIHKMEGIHILIAIVLDAMPTNTFEDFECVLDRLSKIPELIEQQIILLKKGLASGITPSKVAIQGVPQQIKSLITEIPEDSYYFAPFKKIPSALSEQDCERLTLKAKDTLKATVFPALERFHEFIVEHYIPGCRETVSVSDLPNGKEWYLQYVQSHTTTELTPQEIHEMGVREVARIRQEMDKILEEVGFNGPLEQFFIYLRNDPRFFYTESWELLYGYEALLKNIESALPKLFGKVPRTPCEVVSIPGYSEENAVAAYYVEGSFEANRPGRFFVNTSHIKTRPKWEMEALTLHEALPGHHMQLSIASENKNLPGFRKITFFTAYIEGWGLYAEGLGKDLGLYQDPYSWFGRLNLEMVRAVRLVLDTGIHALGWSRQQAIDYFAANTGLSLHEIESEVDRYIALPGQALAYKIGELKILEMRRLAETTLGARFDIRAFHDEVLEHAAMPLTVFEEKMRDWIANQ